MVYSAVAGRRPAKIWDFGARCSIVDTPPGVGGVVPGISGIKKGFQEFPGINAYGCPTEISK